MSLNGSVRIGSAAVLAALSLAACGGSPDDASAEDFCDVWTDDRGNTVEDVHEAAETLEDVGTPEDIEDAARDGFTVFVEVLADVDQDVIDAMEEVSAETGLADLYGIDEDEAADVLAFFEYANSTCVDTEGESAD
jgi:hypothetical protein